MSRDDLAEQVAGVATLADPVRRDLYLYVSAQSAPVSRDQASDALGIARHTAKFHLDKLAEEGLLDISFKRLSERRGPGSGRPTKLYARSSQQLSVSFPERRYELAASLLATAIDSAAAPGTTLPDALKAATTDWGHRVADQARAAAGPGPSPEQLRACTCQALAENGYEPQRTGGAVVLRNCPFDVLAREHTELVCGMNLAIMNAITEQLQDAALTARLEPAPDRCCVVFAPTDHPAVHVNQSGGLLVNESSGPHNWNQKIIEEFRTNEGKVGGYFEGAHMVLIHHIGARSGKERVNPLTYLPDGDDMIIAATKGGAPRNPDWYYNLKEHPRITVEVGTAVFRVNATEVMGEERDELWRRLVELRPGFAAYETKTSRLFPMFRLTRLS